MAQGWAGNVATLGYAKQSAKGTPAATPVIKTKLTGGGVAPESTVNRFQETSGTRDIGASFKAMERVRGNPGHYVRSEDFHDFAYYALGTNADSGAGPFTHTATPSDTDLPYVTIFKMLAATSGVGALLERYQDCKLNTLKISAQAGQPVVAEFEWMGLVPSFLAANDAVAITGTTPYVFDLLTISKGGSSILTCESFEVTIANNLDDMMGNGSIVPYDIFPGQRVVSGAATILYENTDNYRAFHYGGIAGTAASRTLFTEQLIFTLTKDASNSIIITMPSCTYTDVPVNADPGGNPITSALAFNAEPATPTITIATKNATTTIG